LSLDSVYADRACDRNRNVAQSSLNGGNVAYYGPGPDIVHISPCPRRSLTPECHAARPHKLTHWIKQEHGNGGKESIVAVRAILPRGASLS